jgi:chromate transporter
MKILLELFYIFARIGLFTFGGGYAMISIIEDICVERKKWISHEEMMNMTVIAESTPGPIAINCATYVGYKLAGLAGAIVATFGMVLPSFVVIFIVSKFLDNFLEIKVIANAFLGIKIAVGILIFDAAITMIKKMKKKIFPRVIMISAFLVMTMVNIFSWNFSSINLMLIAGVLSLIIFAVQTAPDRKGGAKK